MAKFSYKTFMELRESTNIGALRMNLTGYLIWDFKEVFHSICRIKDII